MINETLTTLTLPYTDQSSKTVRVFVPAHEEGETFPVVYMTDGQNVFELDKNTGQLGSWYTREAIRAEKERSGKAAIIVGIHNDEGPMERSCDLTPKAIGTPQLPPAPNEEIIKMQNLFQPRGEFFGDFVIHTVMPAVEAQFPVRTGRESTAFCGSSSGGLEALYMALYHADIFCASGVFSPVPVYLMYHKEEVDRWIGSSIQTIMPFLYLYVGGEPGIEQDFAAGMHLLHTSLQEYYPQKQIKLVVKPDAPHHESAWATVFEDFLHIFLTADKNN